MTVFTPFFRNIIFAVSLCLLYIPKNCRVSGPTKFKLPTDVELKLSGVCTFRVFRDTDREQRAQLTKRFVEGSMTIFSHRNKYNRALELHLQQLLPEMGEPWHTGGEGKTCGETGCTPRPRPLWCRGEKSR